MGIISKALKGIGSVVVLGVVIGACSAGTSDNQSSKVETKHEQPKKKGHGVNKENFEKLVQGDGLTGEGGTSIEEAKALMNKKPSTESESIIMEKRQTLLSYNDLANGVGITLTFIEGKLSYKSYTQF